MGDTEILEGTVLNTIEVSSGESNKKSDGCVCDNVAGSYIHGIFDNSDVVNTIVKILLKQKGMRSDELEKFDIKEYKESQYDLLADRVRKSIDMKKIYNVMGIDSSKSRGND
jgi:adenosylcobyric acid synthase